MRCIVRLILALTLILIRCVLIGLALVCRFLSVSCVISVDRSRRFMILIFCVSVFRRLKLVRFGLIRIMIRVLLMWVAFLRG